MDRPAPREEDYYDDDDYDRGGSRIPMVLAVVAIIIFLAGMGYFLWVSFFSGLMGTTTKNYNVPNLLYQTVEEARAKAEVIEAQFQIVEGGTMDSTAPAGQIVLQNPEYGHNAAAGSTITVTLSNGSGAAGSQDTMPGLFNMDYRMAQTILRRLGYSEEEGNLIIEEESSEEITKDLIIRQTPAEKESLDGVASVTLVVSTGPQVEMVTVIDFTRMSEEKARESAEELKLTVGSMTEEYDPEIPAGSICYQSIAPTTKVEAGRTINFKVSIGPDPNATLEPTPSPTPEAPPEPTPTPTPNTGPAPTTWSVPVELPNDGRETVQVRIVVGNDEAYNQPVNTILGQVSISVSGTGMQTVYVFIDNTLLKTVEHNFNP